MRDQTTERVTSERVTTALARTTWTTVAGALVLLTACTDADLDRIPRETPFRDDKLDVTGEFCTAPPGSRVFPLRVLFVVDSSDSMRVTDPPDPVSMETGREKAVRETWEELLANDPEGVRVGLIRFSSEAQSLTPSDLDGDALADTYYTASDVQLRSGTSGLAATDRTTNYLNALSEAQFEMRTELQTAALESLPLSRYVVIFVSDGLPDTDSSEMRENSRENILDSVRALVETAKLFRVGEFAFHTAYLSGGTNIDEEAEDLLKRMAEIGGGNFRSFAAGEELNFLFVDFTIIQRVFTLKTLSVLNTNVVSDADQITRYLAPGVAVSPDGGAAGDDGGASAIDGGVPEDAGVGGGGDGGMAGGTGDGGAATPDGAAQGGTADPVDPRFLVDLDGDATPDCGEPLVDSDSDGLSDLVEAEIGTSPIVPDTDDDGLNDRLEWRLAELDPLDPLDARCFVPDQCLDGDDDGFCDCVVDFDVDGVCDCVSDMDEPCLDPAGHDCLDGDMDGFCDCPDRDADGLCDYPDTDGDGMTDCEEVFFGTAQNGNDTDADGLPDWLEVRADVNAVEPDRRLDADLDASQNGDEVLAGTDPWCDDAYARSLIAYRYRIEQLGLTSGQNCYEFDVDSITVVPTAENPAATAPGNGWNRILLFAGSVSVDDPEAFASYRIACVMAAYEPEANYKNPPSGRIELSDEDFHDSNDFNPDTHCIWP